MIGQCGESCQFSLLFRSESPSGRPLRFRILSCFAHTCSVRGALPFVPKMYIQYYDLHLRLRFASIVPLREVPSPEGSEAYSASCGVKGLFCAAVFHKIYSSVFLVFLVCGPSFSSTVLGQRSRTRIRRLRYRQQEENSSAPEAPGGYPPDGHHVCNPDRGSR